MGVAGVTALFAAINGDAVIMTKLVRSKQINIQGKTDACSTRTSIIRPHAAPETFSESPATDDGDEPMILQSSTVQYYIVDVLVMTGPCHCQPWQYRY